MSDLVKVAEHDEIKPGERKLVGFEEVTVAVFNIGGHYYCIEDVCTHDGGPVAEGRLDGFAIECPRHGALFDVRSGSVLSIPAVVPVPAYEVSVHEDGIYIPSPDEAW